MLLGFRWLLAVLLSFGAATNTRTESYFYDGQRRIQEVVTDPVEAPSDGPKTITEYDLAEPPAPGSGTYTRLEREYLWGPPTGGYIDELLIQWDMMGRAICTHQDVSYNVTALARCCAAIPKASSALPRWACSERSAAA